MELVYDPTHATDDRGFFRCKSCGLDFNDRRQARHEPTCTERGTGYDSCELHFGDEQVRLAVQRARVMHDDTQGWYGVSVDELRRQGYTKLVQLQTSRS